MIDIQANAVHAVERNNADVTRVSLPELVRLKNVVSAIKRPRGSVVKAPLAGGSNARALGRGLDFSEVREYQPGDDVRNIDWKVTARSGRPHTKLYLEERERPFMIAVDIRHSMLFATKVAFKSVIASRLAAMLAWCAASQRDRVGGIVFDNKIIREVKPAAGSKGVTRLLHAIVTAQQADRVKVEPRSLEDIFHHLRRTAHTGSSIVFLSDFDRFEAASNKAAARLMEHNHVVACRVYDQLEKNLPPPARYTITDGVNRGVIDTTAQVTRDDYELHFTAQTTALSRLFSTRSSHFIECATNDSLISVAGNIIRSLPGSAS